MHADPSWLIAAGGVFLTQAVVFFRWMYRKMRDEEIRSKFVKDMATNHLPHIYHVLRLLCETAGVEVTEPPQVQFVDFGKNGTGRH